MNITNKNKNSTKQDDIYHSIFEGSGDAMYLMKNLTFIDANQALLELFGCTRKQLFERVPSDFSPDFQPNGISSFDIGIEKINAAIARGKQNFEYTYSRLVV